MGPRAVLHLRVLLRVARPLATVTCHLEPNLQGYWACPGACVLFRLFTGPLRRPLALGRVGRKARSLWAQCPHGEQWGWLQVEEEDRKAASAF